MFQPQISKFYFFSSQSRLDSLVYLNHNQYVRGTHLIPVLFTLTIAFWDVPMNYSFGDPSVFLWIFRICAVMGVIMGLAIFVLLSGMGRKERRAGAARPGLGVLFGSLICVAFFLLAHQMTDHRFFTLSIEAEHLTLSLASNDTVNLDSERVEYTRVSIKQGVAYLLIATNDGHVYRSGPCLQGCEQLGAELERWAIH